MKTEYNDLLIEIGVEELPPKSLKALAQSFEEHIAQALTNLQLSFEETEGFVTPRRLAVRVSHLSGTQPPQNILKKGPLLSAAFDKDGKPTPAALGFASACQISLEALKTQQTDKGVCLVYEQTLPGQSVMALLPKVVHEALRALPIPKHMRWGELKESFVRPVHWVVLLFGEQVISAEFFGIRSNCMTQGHRFHHPAAIHLNHPSEYEDRLLIGKVIPSFEARRELIETELKTIAKQEKAIAKIDPDLLDQVTGLVEWPVVLLGQFDDSFLALPKEVLISSMQVHQKCFPLLDKAGKLLSKFLIVSNIQSTDPKTVIQGNECVMRARLQDAAFFYQVDNETPLEARQEDLKKVVFQHGLGSLWDKSTRIKALSEFILDSLVEGASNCPSRSSRAVEIPSSLEKNTTRELIGQAALLCKTDLLTQMVGEFPELQGIMGYYYALHDKKPEKVAKAIEEHYYPRFAQDVLPNTFLGLVLALSDRVDTLVGFFGLAKHPTGDKDPFALRRQALAILRIIIEQELNLDLKELFSTSVGLYGNLLNSNRSITEPLLDFCFERFRHFYQYYNPGMFESRFFDAVLASHPMPTRPWDFHRRMLAVGYFPQEKAAESLSAANKRIRNILAKSNIHVSPDDSFENNLLKEEAEKKLAEAILTVAPEVDREISISNYAYVLKLLDERLKAPIDQFFDSVMVMVDDVELRNNRLKLLNRLRTLFLKVADLSLL